MSGRVKNWFRAYLNLGLIEKILGHPRLIPCVAGTEFAFIDPWSDVWACNVRRDLPLGNLAKQSWESILASDTARQSIGKVAACQQNCCIVTTARTAMNPASVTAMAGRTRRITAPAAIVTSAPIVADASTCAADEISAIALSRGRATLRGAQRRL